jgi:hypothetical protein
VFFENKSTSFYYCAFMGTVELWVAADSSLCRHEARNVPLTLQNETRLGNRAGKMPGIPIMASVVTAGYVNSNYIKQQKQLKFFSSSDTVRFDSSLASSYRRAG